MCTSKLLVEEKKEKKTATRRRFQIKKALGGTVFYWEVKARDAPKSIKRGCKGRRRLCVERLKPKWVKNKGLKRPELALLRE
jgi:hypothetical protein